jgi:hypothetical protein
MRDSWVKIMQSSIIADRPALHEMPGQLFFQLEQRPEDILPVTGAAGMT